MSSYFSQIASRSGQLSVAQVVPAINLATSQGSSFNEVQPFDGEVSRNAAQQDYNIPEQSLALEGRVKQLENNSLLTPTGPDYAEKSAVERKREKLHVEEQPTVPSYITRHVERATVLEKENQDSNHSYTRMPTERTNEAGKVDFNKSVQEFIDPEDNKNVFSITERANSDNEKAETKFQKSRQQQYNTLKPSVPFKQQISLEKQRIVEPTDRKVSTEIPKKTAERLSLVQPSQKQAESSMAANSKPNRHTPKLVIGKITVEVLPPEKPALPKIITRLIKNTPASEHSKPGKLSFGLGQL
jgi:hypothetical protein